MDDPVVHADVEVAQHEDRRLEAFGEVEGIDRELERFARIGRKQADVARVAVRGIGAEHQVALLRARRHAGRWAGALHIEERRRDFGVVGEADELAHQRDARARTST